MEGHFYAWQFSNVLTAVKLKVIQLKVVWVGYWNIFYWPSPNYFTVENPINCYSLRFALLITSYHYGCVWKEINRPTYLIFISYRSQWLSTLSSLMGHSGCQHFHPKWVTVAVNSFIPNGPQWITTLSFFTGHSGCQHFHPLWVTVALNTFIPNGSQWLSKLSSLLVTVALNTLDRSNMGRRIASLSITFSKTLQFPPPYKN